LVGIQKVSYQNMVDQNIGLPNLFSKKCGKKITIDWMPKFDNQN